MFFFSCAFMTNNPAVVSCNQRSHNVRLTDGSSHSIASHVCHMWSGHISSNMRLALSWERNMAENPHNMIAKYEHGIHFRTYVTSNVAY